MQNTQAKIHTALIGIIILVLVLFMMSIGLRLFTRAILVDRMGIDNVYTQLVLGDETKLIRADKGNAVVHAEPGDTAWSGLIGSAKNTAHQYSNMIQRLIEKTDYYSNQQLLFRRSIVEAANRYEKIISWNMAGYSEYNNVIDLGEGYLTTFMNWTNIHGNIEAVAEFKQYLDTRNIPLLFVQIPNKISRQDTMFNKVVDFYNVNADELVGGIGGYGIHTFDLRDFAEAQKVDYRSMFYNTDHHWRPEAGLWAAGLIGDELNRSFGFDIDPSIYNPDNYHTELYANSFLGSLGRKVTLARATPDDFALIYPKFDVDLNIQIPTIGLDATGNFEIIYDYSPLNTKDFYERELYGMYLHSVAEQHGFIRLVNNMRKENGPRVLLLGDSFSCVLAPFLALGLSQLDFIDLHHYEPALRDLIEAEGYDMVITAYSTLYEVEYDSGRNMYDFR